MDAHEYVGADDHCLLCGRAPGNYLHAGMGEAEYRGKGWEERIGQGRLEVSEPPLVLTGYQTPSPSP